MSKIRVSAISYTNTKPFVYGLEHSGIADQITMNFDVPSECARKLIADEADLGIVPVAALPLIKDYHIVSDYCIGAIGPVNSVFIFSEVPIDQVKTIRLDPQSRTSNNLSKVLLKYHWKVAPVFITEGDADAYVEIGDRTFGKASSVPYSYDLAEEWIAFSGLPFVFAVWASNKSLPDAFIADFNNALQYGLEHRKEVIAAIPERDDFDFDDYLNKRIDYPLDSAKRAGLEKFLELLATV